MWGLGHEEISIFLSKDRKTIREHKGRKSCIKERVKKYGSKGQLWLMSSDTFVCFLVQSSTSIPLFCKINTNFKKYGGCFWVLFHQISDNLCLYF